MSTTKYVDVAFGGERSATSRALYQYDYGQVLRVTDLDLPVAYEVHFASDKTGNSVTQIGNADGVAIPDSVLLTARSFYAWFYLHEGEEDGETRYEILIPVIQRARPTNATPTPVQQDVITETIAALDDAVERAEAAAAVFAVDSEFNSESENPVENRVVTGAVYDIAEAVREPVLIASKSAGTEELPEGFSTTTGYLRGSGVTNPGNLTGTSNANNRTIWMQAAEDMYVWVAVHSSSPRLGIFRNEPYGEANRVSYVYTGSASYPMPTRADPLYVTAGQYITFGWYNGKNLNDCYWELYKLGEPEFHLKSTTPLTDTMTSEVAAMIADPPSTLGLTDTQSAEVDSKVAAPPSTVALTDTMSGEVDAMIAAAVKAEIDSLNADNGYQTLGGSWARGDWDGWSSHTSRAFRVRRTTAISFDRDVILIANEGYMFGGYTSSGSIGDWKNIYKLAANTPLKLNVRRAVEVSGSNPDADVDTFAVQVKSATVVSPINLYQPTWTDVSMFERMGIGGDSYAGGGGIISGIRSLTWGKNLERQAGITVDIYAKSGTDVVAWSKNSTYGLGALLAGTECGLYWLQHGINGTSTAAEIGTPADMSADPQPDTFYGRYAYTVQQIQATFPHARIVLATITGSAYGLSQSTYAEVNTAIRNIAEFCGVPCIDIVEDPFFRSTFYGGWTASNHPTAPVAAGMAMAYRRLISKCIQANKDYFWHYGASS